MPAAPRSAGEPVGVRENWRAVRPAVGARAVAGVMGTIPEQPPQRRQRHEAEPHEEWLSQGTALSAVGAGDDRPLHQASQVLQVVPAISGQAKGRFGELLLEQARPKLDHQVGFDLAPVPETVSGSWGHRQLLAWSQLEARAVDGKGGGS